MTAQRRWPRKDEPALVCPVHECLAGRHVCTARWIADSEPAAIPETHTGSDDRPALPAPAEHEG